MTGPFDRIALIANSQTRHVLLGVARELRRRHGSVIHLYCNSAQECRFYRGDDRCRDFASIQVGTKMYDATREPSPDPEAVVAEARRQEARIGCTYNELAVADRHYGRGYALAGFYHPRSRDAVRTDYAAMLHAYNRHFAFWDSEIADKGLTLMIGGPKAFTRAAKANGIPWRGFTSARFENYHFWAADEFADFPELEATYSRLPPAGEAEAQLDRPYFLVGVNRRRFLKRTRAGALLARAAGHSIQRVYWHLRGYEKAKGYYYLEQLKYLWRMWRDTRRMTGPGLATLESVKHEPYVFFPLATEPETTMGQFSPEFFFQHAAIAALSRDLPAGVKLVVKEALYAVGRRPANFYDQIGELKNVIVLDMFEPGLEVVRNAAAVASITGSAGYEAAVLGKPLISFSLHNHFNFLPHVEVVTDLAHLRGPLSRALEMSGEAAAAARRAGARYLEAVAACSFDMGGYDRRQEGTLDAASVAAACDALERSLQQAGGDRRRLADTG